MSIEPLLASSVAIQVHVAVALLALVVGLGQFCIARGTDLHRTVGWVWILLMAATALSSFFIHQIRLFGLWSPIHLLSILTLVSLVIAVYAIRRRDLRTHRYTMVSLFVFALVGAGAFTLVPGRLMHAVMVGG